MMRALVCVITRVSNDMLLASMWPVGVGADRVEKFEGLSAFVVVFTLTIFMPANLFSWIDICGQLVHYHFTQAVHGGTAMNHQLTEKLVTFVTS